MMLTGLDDMTVARIRHWADVHGTTPSDYLVRLVDLHDRMASIARSQGDDARANMARELLLTNRLET
jgi:hypothetical protein